MAPIIVLTDFLTGDFRMELVEKQMDKAMKVVICSHRRYRKRKKDKADIKSASQTREATIRLE